MERANSVTVIINPQANHGRAREVVPVVKRAFPDARVFVTEEAGDAEGFAGAIEKSAGVVAVGGDGTVFEIVNGLAAAGRLDVPLGVIPCGSGNDFCKTAGLPLAFDAAVKAVLAGLESGLTRQLDLGYVNGRYYVNSLAVGFDARVTHVANTIKEETQKSGLTLYLTALFRVVFHDFYCHTIRLRLDGADWEERDVLLVAVNNGYVYGGGFKITPEADPADGLLDVCVIDAIPRWQVLWRLPFAVTGRHKHMRPAHFSKVRTAEIESKTELPAALDGELIHDISFKIEVKPGALRLLRV